MLKKVKKTNKDSSEFLDSITERNMKRIIIICILGCLFCEFVPDMIDVCKLFNYSKIVVFLQPHKDFFTNIALGCLGSAVISYLMLYIQIKVKESEKKENLEMHFRNIISEYYIIFYGLENVEHNEYTDRIKGYIKEANDNIQMDIRSLIKNNENLDKNIQSKELYEIIVQKIYSISDEIKSFFDALDLYNFEEIPDKEYYSAEFYSILMKKVYKTLFDLLEQKYKLKELNKKIDKLSMPLNISSNILDENMKKMESISVTQKEITLSLTYSRIINEIFQTMSKSYYSE